MRIRDSLVLLPIFFLANAHADGLCMDMAITTPEINVCAANNLADADRELNAVYRQVLARNADDKDFLRKFRAAQRAWLAFRNAEIAARYPDPNPQAAYGSSYPACATGLKEQLTRSRTAQLRMWLDGIPEGDVCTGSFPINGDPD